MIGILITSGIGCAVSTTSRNQTIEEVNAREAFELIQDNRNNPDFVIIDVRTPQEYAEGHVEDSVNIDFNSDLPPKGIPLVKLELPAF